MSFININHLRTKKTIKQCLILCVAAYVTFTALFTEMNDDVNLLSLAGRFESSQRSLQDQEHTFDEISNATSTDIVVLVTGEKNAFPMWLDRLQSISISMDKGSISLLFGSTDEMIPRDACTNDRNLPCQVAFIPGTTWIEGRTILLEEALQKEVRRNEKYDYWLFLDGNVEADCSEDGWAMGDTLGEGKSCWEKIFNYIANDQVPAESASTIALPLREGQRSLVDFSTKESMFAAVKRDRIAHLLRSWNKSGSFWTIFLC